MYSSSLFILGPCSAESEQQVLATAAVIHDMAPNALFRAGLWKPRTNPGAFSGVGEKGLEWLIKVQDELGMPVATEVATPEHVTLCLNAGIRHLWIGARTTSNPIMVQAIAETIGATNEVTLYVKNPINPDIALWLGTIERFKEAGVKNIVAVHRGFSTLYSTAWRNAPVWSIPMELKRRYPDLLLLCDPSHIAGEATKVCEIAQEAMTIGYDGLMIECHISPDKALSDAAQQLTPDALGELLQTLPARSKNIATDNELAGLRQQIDEIDDALWQLILQRLDVAQQIGNYKRTHKMTVLQSERYEHILTHRLAWAKEHGVSEDIVRQVLEAIHAASIKKQV